MIPSIQKTVEMMTAAVQSQGRYSRDLDYAINVAASDYVVYLRAAQEVRKLKCLYYETGSREGNTVYREHPALLTLRKQQQAVQLSLKSVGLTLQTLAVTDEDPVDAILSLAK